MAAIAATRFTNGFQTTSTARAWGYYGVSPADGNVVVTFDEAMTGAVIVIVELNNVDTGTPIIDSDGHAAATVTATLAGGDANDRVVSGQSNHANAVPGWDNSEVAITGVDDFNGFSYHLGELAGGASITTGSSNVRSTALVTAMFGSSGSAVAIQATTTSANITASGDATLAYTVTSGTAIGIYILGEDGGGDIVSAVTFEQGFVVPLELAAETKIALTTDSVPAAPTAVGAAWLSTGVNLSWTDNTAGNHGFAILRRVFNTNPYIEVDRVDASTTTWTDTTADSVTEYDYIVITLNHDFAYGAAATAVQAYVTAVSAASESKAALSAGLLLQAELISKHESVIVSGIDLLLGGGIATSEFEAKIIISTLLVGALGTTWETPALNKAEAKMLVTVAHNPDPWTQISGASGAWTQIEEDGVADAWTQIEEDGVSDTWTQIIKP